MVLALRLPRPIPLVFTKSLAYQYFWHVPGDGHAPIPSRYE